MNFFSFFSYEIEASAVSFSIKSMSKFSSVKPLVVVIDTLFGDASPLNGTADDDDEFKNSIAASRILRYASEDLA